MRKFPQGMRNDFFFTCRPRKETFLFITPSLSNQAKNMTLERPQTSRKDTVLGSKALTKACPRGRKIWRDYVITKSFVSFKIVKNWSSAYGRFFQAFYLTETAIKIYLL